MTRTFETVITVFIRNGKGALAQVAAAVAAAEAYSTHISMSEELQSETAEMKTVVAVRDRLHLADVLRALKRAPMTLQVSRVKP